MPTIRFKVDENAYSVLKYNATVKGLTVSALAKFASFQYCAKYAPKGVLKEKDTGYWVWTRWGGKTVQSVRKYNYVSDQYWEEFMINTEKAMQRFVEIK